MIQWIKDKGTRRAALLCWAALLLAASACRLADVSVQLRRFRGQSPWVTAWLQNPTCQPPCWENIHPGVTDRETALHLLAELSYGGTITEDAYGNISLSLPAYNEVILDTEHGVVSRISLELDLDEKLSLDEIMQAYGAPSEVRFVTCQHGTCEMELLFAERGIVASSLVPAVGSKSIQASIQASAQVGRVDLIESVEKWVVEFPGQDAPLEWHGYGLYPDAASTSD